MRGRRGHTLPELLVATVLSALICSALAAAVMGGERLARSHGWRVQVGEALRVAEAALGGDLRVVDPAADLRAIGEDSIVLRVFRGAGVVCASGGGTVTVRYRGLRAAEPEKDSVLVIDDAGAGVAAPLIAVQAAGGECTARAGESLRRWTLEEPAPPGTLLLVFETGGYHLADGALRYRRGESGRQPLTAELLDVRRSGFHPSLSGGGGPAQPAWTSSIEGEFAPEVGPARGGRAGEPFGAVRMRYVLMNGRGVGQGGEP